MATRREFLQITMAAPVMSMGATANTPDTSQGRNRPITVVCDDRLEESREFARRASRMGMPIATMHRGDITRVWFREMQSLWEAGGAPVMGLTEQGPLFCLEQLAVQYGMRVVFRAEHLKTAPDILNIHGPQPLVASCQNATPSTRWEHALVDVISACPSGLSEQVQATIHHTGAVFSSTRSLQHGALIAWLIAPATQQTWES